MLGGPRGGGENQTLQPRLESWPYRLQAGKPGASLSFSVLIFEMGVGGSPGCCE